MGRTLDSAEVELYRLLLRTSIHPFCYDGESSNAASSNYGPLPVLRKLIVSALCEGSDALNDKGMQLILQRLKTYAAESQAADPIFADAVEQYVKVMRRNGRQLLSTAGQLVDDFVLIWSTVLQQSIRDHRDGHQDLEAYTKGFLQYVAVITGSKLPRTDNTLLVPSVVHNFLSVTPSSFFISRASRREGSRRTPILSHRDLCELFDVDQQQHEQLHDTETRIKFPDSVIRELQLRMLTLDNHPFYNKSSFVHKTAAFYKWRDIDTQKTLELAQRLTPDVELQLRGLPGQISVHVIRAEGMMLPKGVTRLYCQIKMSGASHKTRIVDATKPTWNEIFDLDMGKDADVLKIRLYGHHGATILPSLLHTGDHCGRLDIPLSVLSQRQGRQTFTLDNNAGHLVLAIQFLAFDKPETLTCPNYNMMYLTLLDTVLEAQRKGKLTRAQWEKAMPFLEEFGKRYGVRALFRRIMHLERYLTQYASDSTLFNHRELHSLFASASSVLNRNNSVKPTLFEFEAWNRSYKLAHDLCTSHLRSFRVLFPANKPEGELDALLRTIQILPRSDTGSEDTKSVSEMVKKIVVASTESQFDAFFATASAAALAEGNASEDNDDSDENGDGKGGNDNNDGEEGGSTLSEVEVVFLGYVKCAEPLLTEVADMRSYYSSSFSPFFSIVDEIGAVYAKRLMSDTESLLAANLELRSIVVFRLLATMRAFSEDIVRLVSTPMVVPSLNVQPYINFVFSYLEDVGGQLVTDVPEIVKEDEGQGETESGVLPSAEHISRQINDMSDFLEALNWPHREQHIAFLDIFLSLIIKIGQYYVVLHYDNIDKSLNLQSRDVHTPPTAAAIFDAVPVVFGSVAAVVTQPISAAAAVVASLGGMSIPAAPGAPVVPVVSSVPVMTRLASMCFLHQAMANLVSLTADRLGTQVDLVHNIAIEVPTVTDRRTMVLSGPDRRLTILRRKAPTTEAVTSPTTSSERASQVAAAAASPRFTEGSSASAAMGGDALIQVSPSGDVVVKASLHPLDEVINIATNRIVEDIAGDMLWAFNTAIGRSQRSASLRIFAAAAAERTALTPEDLKEVVDPAVKTLAIRVRQLRISLSRVPEAPDRATRRLWLQYSTRVKDIILQAGVLGGPKAGRLGERAFQAACLFLETSREPLREILSPAVEPKEVTEGEGGWIGKLLNWQTQSTTFLIQRVFYEHKDNLWQDLVLAVLCARKEKDAMAQEFIGDLIDKRKKQAKWAAKIERGALAAS